MHSTEPTPRGRTTVECNSGPADVAVVTVRPSAETRTKQQVPYFLGISAATAGARGLSLHLVSIPPGAAAEPHVHRGYETGHLPAGGSRHDPLWPGAGPFHDQ